MKTRKTRMSNINPPTRYNDSIAYTGHASASEMFNAAVDFISKKWQNPSRDSYLNIYEFDPSLCVDIHGKPVQPKVLSLTWQQISAAASMESEMVTIMTSLERELGIPYLPMPRVNIESLTLKSPDDIEVAWTKLRKKIAKEQKDVKAISSLDLKEPQTPKSQGTYDAIIAVKNLPRDNEATFARDVCTMLYAKIVARERDKLFYIRRHPDNPVMHACQDEELLAHIDFLCWVLNGNPFVIGERCRGLSSF